MSLVNPQAGLFEGVPDLPEGMGYVPDLLSAIEERALLEHLPGLPFKEFEFHGFLGKRRTVSLLRGPSRTEWEHT